jgi:hypothetical protein
MPGQPGPDTFSSRCRRPFRVGCLFLDTSDLLCVCRKSPSHAFMSVCESALKVQLQAQSPVCALLVQSVVQSFSYRSLMTSSRRRLWCLSKTLLALEARDDY